MRLTPFAVLVTLGLPCTACSDRTLTTEGESSSGSTDDTGTSTSTSTDTPTTSDPCITECAGDLPDTSCDLFMQDCPNGEKCSSNGDDSFCTPVVPNAAGPGQPCTRSAPGVDTCALGGLCWIDDVCHALCTGSADAPICGGGQVCVNGDGLAQLCVDSCDPLMQTCPMGQACVIPSSGVPVCAPDISGAGGLVGDVCDFVNDCDPGNQCDQKSSVPNCAGASCCTPFCDIASPEPACPAGQDCIIFFPEGTAPAGLEFLGTCGGP